MNLFADEKFKESDGGYDDVDAGRIGGSHHVDVGTWVIEVTAVSKKLVRRASRVVRLSLRSLLFFLVT